ncbi:3',5'-cyclic-nucleotide phosphodiesterase [Sorochytrium milnesiophthora]
MSPTDSRFHRFFNRKLSITPADTRVLVVDSDGSHARFVSSCLSRAGYPVDTAFSLDQAFELLQNPPRKQGSSSSTLSDIPEGDGVADAYPALDYSLIIVDISSVPSNDLLKRIRVDQKLSHLPVIMMVGSDEMALAYACLRAGADDYLVKPVLELLEEERAQRITLESKVKKLQDQVSAAVETPLNLITRAVSSLLTNEDSRMSDEARDTLRGILEGLKSSNLYRPAFEKVINDADLDADTKSWLSSEVLRDNVEVSSHRRSVRARKLSSSRRLDILSLPEVQTPPSPEGKRMAVDGDGPASDTPSIKDRRPPRPTVAPLPLSSAALSSAVDYSRPERGYPSAASPSASQHTTTVAQTIIPTSPSLIPASPLFNASPFAVAEVDPYSLSSIELPATLPEPSHMPLLKTWSFDVWSYTHSELIVFLMDIFADIGLLSLLSIQPDIFLAFLADIERGYSIHDNQYHNFRHAFDVTQAGYLFLKTCGGEDDPHYQIRVHQAQEAQFAQPAEPPNSAVLQTFEFTDMERLAFLLACLCHDLCHDGKTNNFHIQTHSPIAFLYNDQSPLENYHAHNAFVLINKHGLLAQLPRQTQLEIRTLIIRCILSTDLAKHVEVMTRFNEILSSFAPADKEHRTRTLEMLMKCADVSNVIRPLHLAKGWADSIQEEMFEQGDVERELGLAVSGFGDRHNPQSARLGITFTDYMCAPLFRTVGKGLQSMGDFIQFVAVTSNYWRGVLQGSNGATGDDVSGPSAVASSSSSSEQPAATTSTSQT